MRQMIYGPSGHGSAGALTSTVDTNVVLSTGGEGGSNAMSSTGGKIRAAGVAARKALLSLASAQLGVPVASLSVSKGVVSGGGTTATYGGLVGGELFHVTLPSSASNILQGAGGSKQVADYKLVTTAAPRIDIPGKVTAAYTYVHNLRIPGMLHGRWVRPRGQGPYLTDGFAK